MADTLSWEQMTGQQAPTAATPAASTAVAAPVKAGALSWEQMTGQDSLVTAVKKSQEPLQVAKDVAGDVAKYTAGTLVTAADTVLGIPGMVGSFFTHVAGRTGALVAEPGISQKLAAQAGQEYTQQIIPDWATAPLTAAINKLSPEDKHYVENSPLGQVMGMVTKGVETAGGAAERATGIPTEDLIAGVNGLLGAAGAKGVKVSVDVLRTKLVEAAYKRKAAAESFAAPKDTSVPYDTAPDAAATKAELDAQIKAAAVERSAAAKKVKEAAKYQKMAEKESDPVLKEAMQKRADLALEELQAVKTTQAEKAKAATDTAAAERSADIEGRIGGTPMELGGTAPNEAAATPGDLHRILTKPGFERTAEDLIQLRSATRGANQRGFIDRDQAIKLGAIFTGVTVGGVALTKAWEMLDPEGYGNWRARMRKQFGLNEDRWPTTKIIHSDAPGTADDMPNTLSPADDSRGMQMTRNEDLNPALATSLILAGAVKGKGGMWHPEAVERLSQPLERSLTRDLVNNALNGTARIEAVGEQAKTLPAWSQKSIRTYLNKHMGTEGDPLKDVELPSGKKWGEITDKLIASTSKADRVAEVGTPGILDEKIPENERVWFIRNGDNVAGRNGLRAELTDYLSHVGDFLRQNVVPKKTAANWILDGDAPKKVKDQFPIPRDLRQLFERPIAEWPEGSPEAYEAWLSKVLKTPEWKAYKESDPLQQYDLVRAVKETAANDARVAKEMEKAAAASMKDLPVYKDFGDGMKWVELKLPEKLSEEQKKNIWRLRPNNDTAPLAANETDIWQARDAKGNPIKNNYTGDLATGKSPEEAHLAGQLAEEGNQMGHCVGGYCAYVASGQTRILSLRDAKGRSHVTVEIEPKGDSISGDALIKAGRQDLWEGFIDNSGSGKQSNTGYGENYKRSNNLHDWVKEKDPAFYKEFGERQDILQIKGKGNRAPVADYLPYVQDLVKGGKWGDVGDLENAGKGLFKDPFTNNYTTIQEAAARAPEQMAALEKRSKSLFGLSSGRGPMGVPETVMFKYLKTGELPKAFEGKVQPLDALAWLWENTENYAKIDAVRGYGKQRGAADVKQLASIAATVGGAALAAYLDPEHPISAAFKGAGAGLLLAALRPKAVVELARRMTAAGPVVRIDQLANETTYNRAVARRAAYGLSQEIEKKVPEAARREAIFRSLDGENIPLSAAERDVATSVRAYYDEMGAKAKDAGVIREVLDDYATRIYGPEGRSLFASKVVGGNMPLESPFGKRRYFPTLQEAMAAGHQPVSIDIAKVLEPYTESVVAAIENRKFIRSVRETVLPDGTKLIMKEGKAPRNYTFIDHPQLRGFRVHPDIAADLNFLFGQKEVGPVLRALDAVNTTQKRMAVSMSLFHAMALEHAMLGATSMLKSPFRGVRVAAQSFAPWVFGESLAVKMIREGGVGDVVDSAMKDGLQFGFERSSPALQELQSNFYNTMTGVEKFLDAQIPQLGKQTIGRFQQLNHLFDRAMWGRFHATMKLETYMDKVAELSKNDAARSAKTGQPVKSREEIGKIAASFTNDVFGGLNWQGIAQEFSSRWGRELASSMLGPAGRFGMRLMLFAPDWTISTTRAFVKAFGQQGVAAGAGAVLGAQVDPEHPVAGGILGGVLAVGAGRALGLKGTGSSGAMGIVKPAELADLHRQYILRSAFIYSTVADAVNYQLSGHHFWENKDPTRIDMGDGRTMQASKHFMEPFHWLLNPRQQALNKLSFAVKEPLEQIMDKEYLSANDAPRMGLKQRGEQISLGDRAAHVAKKMNPIAVQQSWEGSVGKGIAGFMGYPIYGKSDDERAAAKELAKQKATQRRIDKLYKEKE